MEVDEGSTTGDNCQELDLTFLQSKKLGRDFRCCSIMLKAL